VGSGAREGQWRSGCGPSSPADDLLSADGPVSHPQPQLAVELECKPHIRALRSQVPRRVSLLVPKLRVGSA
jgi:hypothetical protein